MSRSAALPKRPASQKAGPCRASAPDNRGEFVELEGKKPTGAFALGLTGTAPGTNGPLLDCNIQQNGFGSVTGPVAFVSNEGERNALAGNRVDLGPSIAALAACRPF